MRAKNVSEYIKAAAPEARPQLRQLRKIIKSAVPKVEERIGWGMPYYRYHGMFVSFGAFKDHVSLFSLNNHLLGKFKKELKKFGTGRGTIRFDFGQKIPETLIKKMLKEKASQNEKEK